MTEIPIYLVGDGWQVPSGLARIARDLSEQLAIPHIGFHPPGLVVSTDRSNWDQATQHSFSHLGDDWGASSVVPWLAARHRGVGVLLVVWDPSRAASYLQPMRQLLPLWQLWGYFAVDGHNPVEKIGGVAADAIRQFDRVTGYTRYGAEILRAVRGSAVTYLPHGHEFTLMPQPGDVRQEMIPTFRPDRDWLIGCVATNQPRKDLRLFIATLAELRKHGEHCYGWLHTDILVHHWSIPDLVDIYAMGKYLRVTTGEFRDVELQRIYQACDSTICVGRGEGYGYPIVESLAVGTPCLHVDYAGGGEITPARWRLPFTGMDYANLYAIGRPSCDPADVATRVQQIHKQRQDQPGVLEAFARGSVQHLRWDHLAPRWKSWLKQGMEQI